jgi:hypothetical protein
MIFMIHNTEKEKWPRSILITLPIMYVCRHLEYKYNVKHLYFVIHWDLYHVLIGLTSVCRHVNYHRVQ